MPVLILVGTLDPNTNQGLGPWFRDGLRGGSSSSDVSLLVVPYSAHGTLNQDAICVDTITSAFINSLGTNYDSSCLSDLVAPDFEGTQTSSQDLSEDLFGTRDLWNANSNKK